MLGLPSGQKKMSGKMIKKMLPRAKKSIYSKKTLDTRNLADVERRDDMEKFFIGEGLSNKKGLKKSLESKQTTEGAGVGNN
jgi:hypothetical protein